MVNKFVSCRLHQQSRERVRFIISYSAAYYFIQEVYGFDGFESAVRPFGFVFDYSVVDILVDD